MDGRSIVETKHGIVDGPNVRPKVLLVVCYHSWAVFEARVLADMLLQACDVHAWEVSINEALAPQL